MTIAHLITLTADDATEYAALKDYVDGAMAANAELSNRMDDDEAGIVTVVWTREGVPVP